jgi:BirA family biotin operon repressor/biotin-[acetyl-CoA-carboxylase] ligase
LYKIPANTLFIGKNLVFMPECHSTNTQALQLCQAPATPEGTLVITDKQTAGRGQMGNVWEAHAGQNLTFSVVLRPSFLRVQEQYYLNMAISLGLCDFLRGFLQTPVYIKWPNDMLVRDKKVCGILIENSIQGMSLTYSVVGIGLNVNQTSFSSSRAASLQTFTGRTHTLQHILDDLLVSLEQQYLTLRQGRFLQLKQTYEQALFGLGENRRFKANEEEFEGVVHGVDEAGRLVLQTAAGAQAFGLKEIEFIY